jgi:hypothetical protein
MICNGNLLFLATVNIVFHFSCLACSVIGSVITYNVIILNFIILHILLTHTIF